MPAFPLGNRETGGARSVCQLGAVSCDYSLFGRHCSAEHEPARTGLNSERVAAKARGLCADVILPSPTSVRGDSNAKPEKHHN